MKSVIPKNNDMRVEVTTKCNYHCVICPREKMTRVIETMSVELFKELFDRVRRETSQYTTITFPGMGEPLLDTTLEKKIEYVRKKKKMAVLILTNGSLLTPQRFRELERLGVTSVRVSFYGVNPRDYSRVHGIRNADMFDKVKDNIRRIVAVKKKTQLLLTFNAIKGENEGTVSQWVRFWENNADLVEVWRPHNWVYGKKFRKIQGAQLRTCGRPFIGPLQIQVDGTVNMCCFDFDGKLTLGDLKKQSLKEIFSSPLYRKIVKHHRSGIFKGSALICEKCDQRNADKSDVMIYNSKFNIKERVKMTSTTYKRMVK